MIRRTGNRDGEIKKEERGRQREKQRLIRQEKWDERKKKEIDTFIERQIIIQREVGKETDKERGEKERERREKYLNGCNQRIMIS
jgi:hypothetical protein